MTPHNTLNVKFSNSQPNKLKSGMRNGAEINLKFSSNVVGDSNGETNFPHNFFLSDTQILRLCKAFAKNSSVNKKFSKTLS